MCTIYCILPHLQSGKTTISCSNAIKCCHWALVRSKTRTRNFMNGFSISSRLPIFFLDPIVSSTRHSIVPLCTSARHMETLDFKRNGGCSRMSIYSDRLGRLLKIRSMFVGWYNLLRSREVAILERMDSYSV